jgi:hypothetical protein
VSIKERIQELKQDLSRPGGPQISTMGNYPFAIVQYLPEEEYAMRAEIGKLVDDLRKQGWHVHEIDLFALFQARLIAEEGEDGVATMISLEQRRFKRKGIDGAMDYLQNTLSQDLAKQDGLAQDVIETIQREIPESESQHSLVLISRAGALYPFYQTSGLLRYLDGKTGSALTVFLYPGSRPGDNSLSFMGEAAVDSDYRPRIY